MSSPPYTQMHPKVNPELGKAIEAFAKSNDLTVNRAATHLLSLGLKTMNNLYGGSIMCYLTNARIPETTENISLTEEEIH